MEFEWDEAKAETNVAKHGIDFIDAIEVFHDPNLIEARDPRSYGEVRYRAIGMTGHRLLLVVFTIRGATYRIISARRANRRERTTYSIQARD